MVEWNGIFGYSDFPEKRVHSKRFPKFPRNFYRSIQFWTENFGIFGRMESAQGNTSKGITFFPKIFHRGEPFHLNSPRNYRKFHSNGKRPRCHVSHDAVKHIVLYLQIFNQRNYIIFTICLDLLIKYILIKRECIESIE